MLVKVCGIQTVHAAKVAVEAGADFIGFVFADSKRKISPKDAALIGSHLPPSVKKVGVFVNETKEVMEQIAEEVNLDYIQLHGDEPASLARELSSPVIKAFSVGGSNAEEMKDYPCDYYLLDSPVGKYHGGNGKTFDWRIIEELTFKPSKFILAGGLTPENVGQAIQVANPLGVDVSSGVETLGEKNSKKIQEFIINAKRKEAIK
ncbi:phosphoribosylanthranilate isomerase [Oceanobacillus manasiensis]|uniref:phosphoribosylanthranilate isomerase n=1 Tax=Oceanobacillus manasiensis TaxID=586413 RepID=UPI0005AAF12D|nr:phosphoribosylanthranilate isomerase [Oceanobacillus manasiensis]